MVKNTFVLMLTVVTSIVLGACSSNNGATIESQLPVKEMVQQMIAKVEQPALMEMPADMVKEHYHLDPTLLEEYTIRTLMMNVMPNEIAILKVKDAKDIPAVEAGIKQRAIDVQKQFETYLPDQYENAKNYKLITKGNYVLFIISDHADALITTYDSFFVKK